MVVTAALEAKDDSDFDQAGQYFARGISPLLIQAGTTLVGMGVAKATSAGAKLVGTRIAALKVSKNPITSEGGKLRVDPAIIADAEADGATAATGKLKDADALKPAKAAGVPKEGPSLGEPRVGVPAKAVAPAAEAPEYAGAAAKGYPGIKITPNGGPDFAGTKYLYDKLQPGQKNIVRIKLQGSRYKDFKEANRLAGFEGAKPPKGYSWHHIDDFNTTTGEATMQLIETGAHKAAYIHKGGVWQYERFHGVKYK